MNRDREIVKCLGCGAGGYERWQLYNELSLIPGYCWDCEQKSKKNKQTDLRKPTEIFNTNNKLKTAKDKGFRVS